MRRDTVDVSFACGRSAFLVAGALALCACAVVGPQSITGGRGLYTQVINRTEDEQILNMLVRLRYDETFGMLSVASVTANLRFSAQAATNIGIGDSDDYAGNLVPLSAGVAYEENPTISYVPLSGEDFMRRMLAPVSVNTWILLGGPAKHPGHVLALAVQRVNGLRNPLPGDEPPSPEFARLVDLYDQLRRAGVLDIAQFPADGGERAYFWDLHDYVDTQRDNVGEFLDLLGIEAKLDGAAILLPIREAVGGSADAVHVQTRSAWDVLRVFGAGIEIPSPHLAAGIVEPVARAVPPAERVIAIRSSEKRPDDATVRIRFRDRWFYVDATDTPSKRAFMFLRTFVGIRLADPAAVQQAPVLTVPVN
jgi:hypothetical protein